MTLPLKTCKWNLGHWVHKLLKGFNFTRLKDEFPKSNKPHSFVVHNTSFLTQTIFAIKLQLWMNIFINVTEADCSKRGHF